jgi:hypothetical protein
LVYRNLQREKNERDFDFVLFLSISSNVSTKMQQYKRKKENFFPVLRYRKEMNLSFAVESCNTEAKKRARLSLARYAYGTVIQSKRCIESEDRMTIESLPEEVLQYILQFAAPDDLYNVRRYARVSKRFDASTKAIFERLPEYIERIVAVDTIVADNFDRSLLEMCNCELTNTAKNIFRFCSLEDLIEWVTDTEQQLDSEMKSFPILAKRLNDLAWPCRYLLIEFPLFDGGKTINKLYTSKARCYTIADVLRCVRNFYYRPPTREEIDALFPAYSEERGSTSQANDSPAIGYARGEVLHIETITCSFAGIGCSSFTRFRRLDIWLKKKTKKKKMIE